MQTHRNRRTAARLPLREVLRIADEAAREHGLPRLKAGQVMRALASEGEIARCLTAREALPVGIFPMILENAQGMLWVDSQYVAYQLGRGEVKYVYVTLFHILEERVTGGVQQDIAQCFTRARSAMRGSGRKYFVAAKYEREGNCFGEKDTVQGNAHPRV